MSRAGGVLEEAARVGEPTGGELHIEYARACLDWPLARLTRTGDVFAMSHEEAAIARAGVSPGIDPSDETAAAADAWWICDWCGRRMGQEYGSAVKSPPYVHSAAACYPGSATNEATR